MEDYDKNKAWTEALESINPNDWVNIPSLLRSTIFLLKDSAIKQGHALAGSEHNLMLSMSGTNKKLELLETSIVLLKNMIVSTDENAKNRIKELNETLTSEILSIKENFHNDIDIKQKSTDKKMTILEENIQSIRKLASTLMTPFEVERLVENVAKETKKSTKKEIHDIIFPELKRTKDKFDLFEENQERIRSSIEEKILIIEKNIKDAENETCQAMRDINEHLKEIQEQEYKEIFALESKIKGLKQEITVNESQNAEKSKTFHSSIENSIRFTQCLDEKIIDLKDELIKIKDQTATAQASFEELQKKIQSLSKSKKPNPHGNNDKKDLSKHKTKHENPHNSTHKEETKNQDLQKASSKLPGFQKDEFKKHTTLPFEDTETSEANDHKNFHRKNLSNIPQSDYHKYLTLPINDTEKNSNSRGLFHRESELMSSGPHSPHSKFLSKDPSLYTLNFEDKFNKELNEHIIPLEKSLRIAKMEMELGLNEIKEKLAWLPMNLRDIQGKGPNEARLFTIEARQRQEENTRVEQFNYVLSLVERLRTDVVQSPLIQQMSSNLPQIYNGRSSARTSEMIFNHETMSVLDNSKSVLESEGKNKFSRSPDTTRIKTIRGGNESKMSYDFGYGLRKNQLMRRNTLDKSVN
ncbi:hypothetical protein SteCoe_1405 [Stentor coeruleus]|uniref:Uncharacterized protein n=1 Tax=Stentor coeruleus TaxID=5963 RepID=A0A1R2D1T7_9CILI|nr:hypothetical protein SteCoe_1405 [Stentor coeruleus]